MFAFPVLMKVNNYTPSLKKPSSWVGGSTGLKNEAFLHPLDLHPESVIPGLTLQACSLISAVNQICEF